MALREGDTWSVNGNVDRVRAAASGVDGGAPGAAGRFGLHNGPELPAKSRVTLTPESLVDVTLPGGGGYGPPFERPVAAVLADVVEGYVSLDAARDRYGVSIRYTGSPDALVRLPGDYTVDEEQTARLRAGK
jgi:N-methylhydantoinase B